MGSARLSAAEVSSRKLRTGFGRPDAGMAEDEEPEGSAAVNAGTSPFWAAPLVHEFKESFRRAFDPSHVAAAASGFELGMQLAEFEGRLNAAHGREYA